MQNCIRFNSNENCFIVNNVIKIDNDKIEKIVNKRNLEDLVKLDDNLYYYKGKTLIELLYDIYDFKKIQFKNNNSDDYRFDNIIITYKEKPQVNDPLNVKILKRGKPKIISGGAYNGQERNYYWKVRDENNNEYYMMHIIDNIYTKFSIEDKKKIFNFNDIRPSWHLHNTGYITSTVIYNNKQMTLYLHQYIMNSHFEDNTNMKKTVDHINRDKLDNRRENLRFATMSEQNVNKDKQQRQHNAQELPKGIKQNDLPKYIVYYKNCYNVEKNLWREFFCVEGHPKQEDSRWNTSKSSDISIFEKLDQAKLKLKHLNGEISDDEYKKITEKDIKLPEYFLLTTDKRTNKMVLIYDKRTEPKMNLKMTLTDNDLQIMIDKFIELINKKYPDSKLDKITLEKPITLNFSLHNNENITVNNKFVNKPDLPPNFSLYKENNDWYLSFNKKINTERFSKKMKLVTLCIQTELNNFIKTINEKYPNLKIENYKIKNVYDFIEKVPIYNLKPVMPTNFSICSVNTVDYIQFCKKINNKKVQYKTKIMSSDIQKELDEFVNYLNLTYNLQINKQNIINTNNWTSQNITI